MAGRGAGGDSGLGGMLAAVHPWNDTVQPSSTGSIRCRNRQPSGLEVGEIELRCGSRQPFRLTVSAPHAYRTNCKSQYRNSEQRFRWRTSRPGGEQPRTGERRRNAQNQRRGAGPVRTCQFQGRRRAVCRGPLHRVQPRVRKQRKHPGVPAAPAVAGETLVFYGTGFRRFSKARSPA